MTDLHRHLRARLLAAATDLGLAVEVAEPLLRLDPPKNREHGDVALGTFQLAKAAGKAPPALAAEIAARITADPIVESATAAGPFVNFRFRRAALAREVLSAIQGDQAPYAKARSNGQMARWAAEEGVSWAEPSQPEVTNGPSLADLAAD